ncbi:cbb3-type cytochrome c oxidase N-terminal domain-containing protein [Longitalea luteola]|uniref:cbb3-type cytochrome c oxidase N-terminal domain-containing protein n=1 Tax=Longitalea luteola TaxID=2812563 RepID=UPI001A97C03A|nr:cbb3-type cytochrome c oxidase N-terminal domain-containing protein [Longitalea luteola]
MPESTIYDPFVVTMIIIMLILLLIIGLLAHVVTGAAGYYYQQQKESAQQKEKAQEKNGNATAITTTIILLLFAAPLFAQDSQTAGAITQTGNAYGGLSATAFYCMAGVIAIELLVVFMLLHYLRVFLSKERSPEAAAAKAAVAQKRRVNIWNKMNKFRPVEQEAEITMVHEYDGIRELDNRLPPWWLYGFYVSIFFAVIYLWRYHVSHTAPLSGQELEIAMAEAEQQKAEYLKKSANNVDENTVQLLTAANEISSGEKLFIQNCAACHGKAGEGIVGPNLTDDYWLHGGSLSAIFKSIKYGWPEKGMRSWKDDLSPVQIAQVTSYIKSIHGTNPPNAKAQQGELYKEEAANDAKTDSLANKVALSTPK